MCQFKSAILLKNRVYVPDHDHHSNMLDELGIEDNYLNASKTFVRVELSPPDGNIASDPMGWTFKVDQDVKPGWYDPEDAEKRVKEAVAEWRRVHVLTEGEHTVNEGVWYAYGSSTVNARGSSKVYAYGSSTVYARGSSKVYARGSTTVYAYDSSKVYAYDSSTVILPKGWQNSEKITLNGSSICINHNTHTIRSAIQWKQEENDNE